MPEDEVTPMDAVQMLVRFSEQVQEQFDKMNQRFDKLDERFDALERRLDERFNRIDQRLDRIESRLDVVEKEMVTQSQFKGLVAILRDNKVISEFDASQVVYRKV